MKLRKFQATNMREAVSQVKAELGPDAMIVATRNVRRGFLGAGVEVTAAIDVEDPETVTLDGPAAPPPPPKPAALTDADVERIMAPLRSEIRALRSALRPKSLESGSGSSAARDEQVLAELAQMRLVLSSIQSSSGPGEVDLHELAKGRQLSKPSVGRVVALVGPTGVGKTTTIAKLAARAALGEGRNIAMVSLDTYRVGGEEQIRIFADLIGVPLVVVRESSRLAGAIDDLEGYERIYVDTAGRSPTDQNAIGELELALANVEGREVHLALAAGSSPTSIDIWARRYKSLPIDRLLFTKLDEAEDLSELVRAPARLGIPVSHLTNGQRVPEDLELATQDSLLSLASSGFRVQEAA